MWSFIVIIFWTWLCQAELESASATLPPPMCAVKCWDNSKFVSQCLDDWACFCHESDYENAVFQCIYAQCDTSSFGAAVHETIKLCEVAGVDIHFTNVASSRQEELRKREADIVAGNLIGLTLSIGLGLRQESAGMQPTITTGGFITTSNTGLPTHAGTSEVSGGSSAIAAPTAPAESASSTLPSQTVGTESTGTSGITLFTGAAPRLDSRPRSTIAAAALVAVAGIYFVV